MRRQIHSSSQPQQRTCFNLTAQLTIRCRQIPLHLLAISEVALVSVISSKVHSPLQTLLTLDINQLVIHSFKTVTAVVTLFLTKDIRIHSQLTTLSLRIKQGSLPQEVYQATSRPIHSTLTSRICLRTVLLPQILSITEAIDHRLSRTLQIIPSCSKATRLMDKHRQTCKTQASARLEITTPLTTDLAILS